MSALGKPAASSVVDEPSTQKPVPPSPLPPLAPSLSASTHGSSSTGSPAAAASDYSVAGGWEQVPRLACKPKKLAVTEDTLHLHWVPDPTVIEQMKKMDESFAIELWNWADGKRGSRKEVMPARPARPAGPLGLGLLIRFLLPLFRPRSWVS